MELPGSKPEYTTESPERFSTMLRPGHHHRLIESEFLGMGPMYLDFLKDLSTVSGSPGRLLEDVEEKQESMVLL